MSSMFGGGQWRTSGALKSRRTSRAGRVWVVARERGRGRSARSPLGNRTKNSRKTTGPPGPQRSRAPGSVRETGGCRRRGAIARTENRKTQWKWRHGARVYCPQWLAAKDGTSERMNFGFYYTTFGSNSSRSDLLIPGDRRVLGGGLLDVRGALKSL